jgi:hypothetical protein
MVADSAEVAEESPWYPTEIAVWILAIAFLRSAFSKEKAALSAAFFGLENRLKRAENFSNPLLLEYQVRREITPNIFEGIVV